MLDGSPHVLREDEGADRTGSISALPRRQSSPAAFLTSTMTIFRPCDMPMCLSVVSSVSPWKIIPTNVTSKVLIRPGEPPAAPASTTDLRHPKR